MKFQSLLMDDLEVSRNIMPGDHMFNPKNEGHYFSVGRSALNCIRSFQLASGASSPESVLDFACGSGRVTRWLRAAFPSASLHASDVRSDSLEFVEASLGALGWISSPRFEEISPPRGYDLIWCGSLITHLDEKSSLSALDAMKGWLEPGGMLVVSFHGEKVLRNFRSGRLNYLPAELFDEVEEGCRRSGHGYVDYPGRKGIGFSLSSREWMLRAMLAGRISLRLVGFIESGWDSHHDVLAVQRVA